MLSSRPYLIRALYDWIIDCKLTPYIVVNVNQPNVNIPEEYTDGSQIVLNISPRACRGLILDYDRIVLTTTFSGKPIQLSFPPIAVLAIYNKENGRGMLFSEEDGADGNTGSGETKAFHTSESMVTADPGSKDSLIECNTPALKTVDDNLTVVKSKDKKSASKSKKKPSLTVIK